MTEGRYPIFGEEADAEDEKKRKMAAAPLGCVIGSAWSSSFTGTIELRLSRTYSRDAQQQQVLRLRSQAHLSDDL